MYSNIKNKKAQIGETMTWTVATVIIVIVLMIFMLSVSLIAGKKNVAFDLGNFVEDQGSDIAVQQMLFSILKYDTGNGKTIGRLIDNKEYSEVQKEVNIILKKWEGQGVVCDFEAGSAGVYYGGDVKGSLDYELNKNDNIKLQCIKKD
jgi:hypothetical protein